jgi:hypothetical protein
MVPSPRLNPRRCNFVLCGIGFREFIGNDAVCLCDSCRLLRFSGSYCKVVAKNPVRAKFECKAWTCISSQLEVVGQFG